MPRATRRPAGLPPHVYRRRRLAALAVLAAAAAGLVLVLRAMLSGEEGSEAEGVPEPAVALARLVGQRIVVRMEDTATRELLQAAREGELGGVIVFPSPGIAAADLRREVDRLQSAAREGGNPPLLVATDQEGGDVRRLAGGPPSEAPPELGAAGAEAARAAGAETAAYLREFGVNTDLAPVLDIASVPGSVMAARAFGSDPATVASTGVGFAEGLAERGVAATAKHFPGLGRTSVNTDLAPATIEAAASELEEDLEPFRAAVAAGIPLVMVSNARYPALDERAPAAWSEPIVDELLRRELGFDGVVITDDLGATAITAELSPERAAVAAARAGADLLLLAKERSPERVHARLLDAARSGDLGREALERAYVRIAALKDRL